MCRDRAGQFCELWDQTWAKPSTLFNGVLYGQHWHYSLVPEIFQQIRVGPGDGDGGESPIPDKSGTGTGERPRPRPNRGRTPRPRPRPRTNPSRGLGRGRGRGPGCPRQGCSDSDHNVAAAPGHWRLVDAAGPGASHVPVGHLGLLALPLSGTQAAALRASDTVTGSGSCQWPSRGGQPRGGTVATFTFLPRKPAAGGGATQPALAVAWAACGPGGRCVCQASGGRNARASRGSPRP